MSRFAWEIFEAQEEGADKNALFQVNILVQLTNTCDGVLRYILTKYIDDEITEGGNEHNLKKKIMDSIKHRIKEYEELNPGKRFADVFGIYTLLQNKANVSFLSTYYSLTEQNKRKLLERINLAIADFDIEVEFHQRRAYLPSDLKR